MSLASELDIPETGAVFTFGKSHFADNEPSHFFIKNDPVVQIACGDDHTIVVCQNGRVFAFGSNGHGQLGLSHTENVERPACIKWLKPRKARQVACGRSHTVILTENHQIYASGDNSEGQLGVGSTESQLVPQYVEIDGELEVLIKQIAAGAEHTVVLTENGMVYACGSNSEGQLGLGEEVKNSNVLTRIPLDKNVTFIACGYYHTVLIADDGEAYIFGDNENQRLSITDASPRVFKPSIVSIGTPIKSAHCGHYHTFFVAENGLIFAAGSNEHGQLGLARSIIEVNHPTEINFDKLFYDHAIVKISCGATHTAFITDNGFLYTCGDSMHQKLCLDQNPDDFSNNNTTNAPVNQYLPRRVFILDGFNVNNVACGGCHTIISAKKLENSYNNNLLIEKADVTRITPLPELPPLQKVPVSIMTRAGILPMEQEKPSMSPELEALPEPPESLSLPEPSEQEIAPEPKETIEIEPEQIEVTGQNKVELDEINGNGKNIEDDKKSIDSLEPNVSGSHILDINDLHPSTVVNAASEISNENGKEQILIVEENINVLKEKDVTLIRQETVIETIEKTTVTKYGELDEIKTEVADSVDNLKSNIPASPKKILQIPNPSTNMLRVPETVAHSPVMSTKSEISQKSIKSSNGSQDSENETILCHSDKSTPQTKASKTQAVIPILRTDEAVTTIESKITDEADVVQSKIAKTVESEGKISKFFSGLRNDSCMGKSRVLSSGDIKEQVAVESSGVAQDVANHTNSRACIII